MKTAFKIAASVIFALGMFGEVSAQTVTSGLVGYWSGNGAANDSVNGNNGSFAGTYVPGLNGVQAFDLSSDKVVISDSSAYTFSGGDFSVALNFNGLAQGWWNYNVFLGQDQGGGSYEKWFVGYNDDSFYFHTNGSAVNWVESGPITVASGWNSFAFVKEGSLASFYLNGALIGTAAVTPEMVDSTASLIIGYAESGYDYSGLIQDVALYNRALTSSEVGQVSAVPEPSTYALVCGSVVLIAVIGGRRKIDRADSHYML